MTPARTILAAALCALCPGLAGAGSPDRLSFMLGSHHFNAGQQYVEKNPGVFLTWNGRLDTTLGIYRNSYGKVAEAVEFLYPIANWSTGQVEAFGGVAHYPGDGDKIRVHLGDLIPVAGLSARWGHVFAVMIPCFCDFDFLIAGGLTFRTGTRH